jgi:hypothetical protein
MHERFLDGNTMLAIFLLTIIFIVYIRYYLKEKIRIKILQNEYNPNSYEIEDHTGLDPYRSVYIHKNQIIKKEAVLKADADKIKIALQEATEIKISDSDNRLYEYRISTPIENLTQSNNLAVLTLYAEIILHQDADSEHWDLKEGNGAYAIIGSLVEHFKVEQDWQDLINDLPNWSKEQLDIFCYCLANVIDNYEGYSEEDPHKDAWLRRVTLMPTLIRIIKNNSNSMYILHSDDVIEFLEQCPSPALDSLIKIKEILQENPLVYEWELDRIKSVIKDRSTNS